MTRNILTNWWGVITAVVGAAAVASGVAGVILGGGGLQLVGSVAYIVSGGLILGGLAVLQRRTIAGSVMIVVGTALTVVDVFTLPVAALVVIGGLWTGHLQLSRNLAEPHVQPVRPQPADVTGRWYLWLAAAPILFVIGLGALVVLGDGLTATGEEDTGLIAGLAWLAWILSWLGAVISGGLGVVFGVRRRVARHRTRPA